MKARPVPSGDDASDSAPSCDDEQVAMAASRILRGLHDGNAAASKKQMADDMQKAARGAAHAAIDIHCAEVANKTIAKSFTKA